MYLYVIGSVSTIRLDSELNTVTIATVATAARKLIIFWWASVSFSKNLNST